MTGSEICTLRRWSRLGRVLAVASCLCLFLMLLDCGKGECTASGDLPGTGEPTTGKWVVELYMCGTDLESKAGAGTSDLVELTQLQPPDGVTFVIQTGGAREWHNNQTKAGEIRRLPGGGAGQRLVLHGHRQRFSGRRGQRPARAGKGDVRFLYGRL